MTLYKIFDEERDETKTHLSGACGDDHTLCGLTLESDEPIGLYVTKIEGKKYTCSECHNIVMFCKTIKKSKYQELKEGVEG